MSETQATRAEMQRTVQRHIFACMETGNLDQARTALREYDEIDHEAATGIQADVVASYGIFL